MVKINHQTPAPPNTLPVSRSEISDQLIRHTPQNPHHVSDKTCCFLDSGSPSHKAKACECLLSSIQFFIWMLAFESFFFPPVWHRQVKGRASKWVSGMAAYYFSTSSCVSEFLIDFPASVPSSAVSEATGFKCISVHGAGSVVNDLDKLLWLSGSPAFLKCCHSHEVLGLRFATFQQVSLEGTDHCNASALASLCQSIYETINI